MSGIEDKTGKYAGRIFRVTLLSEILRIWCDLPEGARILLVLDEPEATLQGGMSRSVLDFKVFRFMIRKLGIAKVEIWHAESDQYKGLREDTSEQVVRIKKDTKDAFACIRRLGDQLLKQRVENVPKDCGLSFATEGMATISVDVDVAALVQRIGKLWRPGDIKAEVRRALEDPDTYHAGHRSKEAEARLEAERVEEQQRRDDERIKTILADQERFMGRRRDTFDRTAIQRHFNTTAREADYLALRAWQNRLATDSVEAAVREVLARAAEFSGSKGGSFDRAKIMHLLGLSYRDALAVAKKARERRRGPR